MIMFGQSYDDYTLETDEDLEKAINNYNLTVKESNMVKSKEHYV